MVGFVEHEVLIVCRGPSHIPERPVLWLAVPEVSVEPSGNTSLMHNLAKQ
jgi:hypothetical protein